MFTRGQRITLGTIAIALMLIAVGCTTTPLPTPGPASVPFPIGMLVDASGSTLELKADGTGAYRSSSMNDDFTYKVNGDQVVWMGGGCTNYGGNATYQWSFDGKVLTFKSLATDMCGGRSVALQRVEFTKKQSPAVSVILASANALNDGDIEKAVTYYTDDAVIKLVGLPPGEPDTFTGKEQIRSAFKAWNAVHFQVQIEIAKEDGGTVTSQASTWSDPTRALGVAPLIGNEVDVIKNGKIAGFTWTISPESAAKLQAAVAKAQAAAQPTPTAPPRPTVTVPKALIGTYKTTITEKDAGGQNYGVDMVGDFEIQYMEGGRLLVKFKGSGVATGEYTATQDTIVFGKDSGAYSCYASGFASGTYKWSSDGKSLTLTKVDDGCDGRVLALTAHPLSKSQ